MFWKKKAVLVLFFVLAVILGTTVAGAALAKNSNVIYGAVQKNNGQLRIIDSPKEVKKSETLIFWNKEGPQGEQGPRGPRGFRGPQGEPGPQGPAGPAADVEQMEAAVADLQTQVNSLQSLLSDLQLQLEAITPVTLSIDDVSTPEGDIQSGGELIFTVTLSRPSPKLVTFYYSTEDGTAFDGDLVLELLPPGPDYAPANGQVEILPGQTTTLITIMTHGDDVYEPDETLFVNLYNAVNADIDDGQGIGTILNDDEPFAELPQLTIHDTVIREGDTGDETLVLFAISLSRESQDHVYVYYEAGVGTAIPGEDYQAGFGIVEFQPGEVSIEIAAMVIDDLEAEPDETFYVYLSSAHNAEIADGEGMCTIFDNDGFPAISISDLEVTEGNNPEGTIVQFQVQLSTASSADVTFEIGLQNGTASAGGGETGDDYYWAGSNEGYISAGETSTTIPIVIWGDLDAEDNETFFVNILNAENAGIEDGQAMGTIIDDDSAGLPTLSINDVYVAEGNSGDFINQASFTVTLSAPYEGDITFFYATADGTATAAAPDYLALSDQVTILPGETSAVIEVPIYGDTLPEAVEGDEYFFVTLTQAYDGTGNPLSFLDGSGICIILEDD